MTNAELNARAAEIMGPSRLQCMEEIQPGVFRKTIWNPAENIAQAFEVAEKFDAMKLESIMHGEEKFYFCHIRFKDGCAFKMLAEGQAYRIPSLAITRACVAAAVAEKKNA